MNLAVSPLLIDGPAVLGASWAPDVPALALALATKPQVLFVGDAVPWTLEAKLVGHGILVERVSTLSEAKCVLCLEEFRLVVSMADVPDGDMVVFVAALKAGQELGGGVPKAVQSMPFVVLNDEDAVGILSTGFVVNVQAGELPNFLLRHARWDASENR